MVILDLRWALSSGPGQLIRMLLEPTSAGPYLDVEIIKMGVWILCYICFETLIQKDSYCIQLSDMSPRTHENNKYLAVNFRDY